MLPKEILDALRLLLRPLWDRSTAVVVVHGSRGIASNFWLCTYAFASQLTSNFQERRY